ncbi:hypothetical protein TELCIR_14466 [Teladorsagia circumcincta]|uniref:Ribosomal protein L1p/L10e family protein n=1 Tax=Teladorsagia circumcincta TaxID=45464 RepID=A0A2G9U0Z3_TELCI|nr:hypothetical protein TELCIR_14466 [Teladorsagia circumcincta]
MVVIKKVKAKKALVQKSADQAESKQSLNRKRKLPILSDAIDDIQNETEKKISAKDEKKETSVPEESDLKRIQNMKDQGRLALSALKKQCAERSGKSLFPDIDQAIGIAVVYKKPPLTTERARVKIELPCPDRTPSDASICLIMPDLDQSAAGRRDPDVDKQARQWAEKIEKDHGLTNQHYSKILTKRQLEREYHTFTQRRALATTYDLFLVDVRVGKAVRSFLGKEFYKVHKHVPLGHLGQPLSDLASNFDAVVDAVLSSCPGGLSNIRSMYVQPVGSSPSLPVYVDNGMASEVKLEKPTKRRRSMEQVTDECSTLPDGLKLVVRKNGKLRVVKEDTGHTILYPTVHDEWEERDGLKPTADPAKLERKHAIKKKRMQKRLRLKKIKSGEVVTVRHEAK